MLAINHAGNRICGVLLVGILLANGLGLKSAQAQGVCGANCSGSLCNAVGIIYEYQVHLRGIWAGIDVATPQIRTPRSFSLMRVVVRADCSHPSGNCFGEVGWIKSDCFTDPTSSCPWLPYGSWKIQTRHVVIRQNPNGYWLWDVANAGVGTLHQYLLEKDNQSTGWRAFIDGGLISGFWTGFSVPEEGWAGGEVPNPPSNAMGVSGHYDVKYMDTNRAWHLINGSYSPWEEHPAYHVVPISSNSWQVYGCN
jgi:hypothetical protein